MDPSKRRTGKNVPAVICPKIPSSIVPVPYGPELLVPNPPQGNETGDASNSSESPEDFYDPNYGAEGVIIEKKPHYPNQRDLNDLIRDLGLTKSNKQPD